MCVANGFSVFFILQDTEDSLSAYFLGVIMYFVFDTLLDNVAHGILFPFSVLQIMYLVVNISFL